MDLPLMGQADTEFSPALTPLQRTFCHVHGIGAGIERRLWQSGIHSWSDAKSSERRVLGQSLWDKLTTVCSESITRFHDKDWQYFSSSLSAVEHWRIFASMPGRTAYIDIETTGISISDNSITIIGLFDGTTVHCFLNHYRDLGRIRPPVNPGSFTTILRPFEEFADEMESVDRFVTFNGKYFDVPILKCHFRNVDFDKPHLDLRLAFNSIGVKGGLKRLEKDAGLLRPGKLDGLNGYDAVKLWSRYRQLHDVSALATLIEYNAQDIVNLVPLTKKFVEMKLAGFPSPVFVTA